MKPSAIAIALSVPLFAMGCSGLSTTEQNLKEENQAITTELNQLREELIQLEEKNQELQHSLAQNQATSFSRDDFVNLLNDKNPSIWGCDSDAKTITQVQSVPSDDLQIVINEFNNQYSEPTQPHIQLVRIDQDTAVITVSDPQLLTQRMGTTGAGCYLAGATFSLTSVKNINYVWFDIEEGSHAGPGRYGRANFPDLWPI